jgi:hypothetical protein
MDCGLTRSNHPDVQVDDWLLCTSRNDSNGFESATIPVALSGVSPASLTIIPRSSIGEEAGAGKVFGETPKTAVETTALPQSNWINPGTGDYSTLPLAFAYI